LGAVCEGRRKKKGTDSRGNGKATFLDQLRKEDKTEIPAGEEKKLKGRREEGWRVSGLIRVLHRPLGVFSHQKDNTTDLYSSAKEEG